MSSVASVISPFLMTQALAAGVERGFPGGAFLLAASFAVIALGIVVWTVLQPVPPTTGAVAEA